MVNFSNFAITGIEKETVKQDKVTFLKQVINYFSEYCTYSSICGTKFVTSSRPLVERLGWVLLIALSFCFCCYTAKHTYDNWNSCRIGHTRIETPITTLPFPAITICPPIKVKKSAFNYTECYTKKLNSTELNIEDEVKFGYLSQVCEINNKINYTSQKFVDNKIWDYLVQAQPKFHNIFSDCKFASKTYDCEDILEPIFTDDGVCYAFNILDGSLIYRDLVDHYNNFHHKIGKQTDWSCEQGYRTNAKEQYPRRALGTGPLFGFQIKLSTNSQDLEYSCNPVIGGFKVSFTSPNSLPRIKQDSFVISRNKNARARITPNVVVTKDTLKKCHSHCYFGHEKTLKYFKDYSQGNCEIEFQANFTREKCGCVKFDMPREKGVPICGTGKEKCVEQSLEQLAEFSVYGGSNQSNLDQSMSINCLPTCQRQNYNVQFALLEVEEKTLKLEFTNSQKNNNIYTSKLEVFFTDDQFFKLESINFFDTDDFIANVGGLFSLFLGCSILSIAEFIYYFSVRIVCNIVMFGKNNWSGTVKQ